MLILENRSCKVTWEKKLFERRVHREDFKPNQLAWLYVQPPSMTCVMESGALGEKKLRTVERLESRAIIVKQRLGSWTGGSRKQKKAGV